MNISCEAYIGYTVTLKTNLKEEDFDFFHRAMEEIELPNRVHLVVDGMCGHYARLIYVDRVLDCWCDDAEYFALKSPEVTDKIYSDLNKAYYALYGKLLDREKIEYALSFHYY